MIYGKRIRLRAIEKEDLPLFVSWLNDPQVRKGLKMYLPLSFAEERKWFEEMLDSPKHEHPLAIEVKEDDGWKIVGNCGFHKIYWRTQSAEIGIFIGEKSIWNKGFGTEAVSLLLQFGFETLNFNRIGLCVFDNNPRAVRAYEKAGFVLEGRLRQAEYSDGKFIDILMMSVLRSEWQDIN